MSEAEKKKTLAELYRYFRLDLDHLDRERLAFMRHVVRKMEDKKKAEVLNTLRV
jgi:hypothetical protein